MASLFKIWNGPFPTTSPQLAVTTGTSLKTMLQLKPFNNMTLVAWGVSLDGAAAAAGLQWELLETGTIFGTVTALVDADCHKWGNVTDQAVASLAGLTLGTAASGYTCTSEGSIVASRVFDSQFIQPTNQFGWEFSLGRECKVPAGNCVRIRVKAPAAVNALCWALVEF